MAPWTSSSGSRKMQQRELHGTEPLAWDSELARDAQTYAEVLALSNDSLLIGDNLSETGENLFMSENSDISTTTEGSESWYS